MIDFRKQPPGYEQGIYKIPFEKYRAIPALNSSKLKHMRKTPAHFKAAMDAPPKEVTATQQRAFNRGKVFDRIILDGGLDAVKGTVAFDPGWSKNSNKYKEWASNQSGKMIMPKEDFDMVLDMVDCAYSKRQFSTLFAAGTPHMVLVWQCRHTGLWCKGELDWVTDEGVLVDLKSTADAGFWFFNRNARRLGYPNQLAHYLDGLTATTGIFHSEALLAAVEVDPPHESHVFVPSEEQLYTAEDQNRERKEKLLACLESEEWPGYLDLRMSLDSGQYIDEVIDDEGENIHGF
jgi:hypothetical protein